MVDSIEAPPQSSQVSPLIYVTDMSTVEYKSTIDELGLEMYNLHTNMLASEAKNGRLILKVAKLEEKIDELSLENPAIINVSEKMNILMIRLSVMTRLKNSLGLS